VRLRRGTSKNPFNEFYILAPGMKHAVPFVLLMRSLGVATEAQMFDLVASHINPSLHHKLLNFIRDSFISHSEYRNLSTEEALFHTWTTMNGDKIADDSPKKLTKYQLNNLF